MHFRKVSPITKKILGTGIIGILVLLLLLFFRSSFSGGAYAALTPLWKGSDGASRVVVSLSDYFRFKHTLIEENKKLTADVLGAQASVLDRNQLFEENLALKERLGREAQPNAALAAVILRPPEVPYDMLLIDIGEDADIEVGDKVASTGALLIGKVSEVYAHTARVTLFSSPGQKYNGFLRGTIPVVVEGQGAGSLTMQVPYDAKAQVGDPIALPGIESNTSSVIDHIKPGQGDSAVTAYMRLPVDPYELRFVDVWRGAK